MKKHVKKIFIILITAIAVILVVLKSRKVPETAFIPPPPKIIIEDHKRLVLDLDNLEIIKKMENDFEDIKAAEPRKDKQETSETSVLDRFTEVYRNKKLKANLKPGFSQIPRKTDSADDLKKKVELNLSVDF